MPGRGSYGPSGKWIYTRAKKLRAKNPDMDESTSFAIATQQAHKVGKSPKGFRTPEGVAMAKAKMRGPVKMYRKTAMIAGFFDEIEKAASLAAAARFGVGVLLGSVLWNSLGSEEKEDLKEKARAVTSERRMPPIIIAPGKSPTMVMREMAKADPYLPEVERRLGRLRDFFPEDLLKMGEPDPLAQSRKQFNKTRRVATFGTKKPPEPNIRAVATKV
jgi:hypothetical protein